MLPSLKVIVHIFKSVLPICSPLPPSAPLLIDAARCPQFSPKLCSAAQAGAVDWNLCRLCCEFCSQVPLERLPEEDLALVLKELALDDSMRRQAETLNHSTRNR